MKEADFTRWLVKELNTLPMTFAYHPVGNVYQGAGLPDVVAVMFGRFYGIECKLVHKTGGKGNLLRYGFTPIQIDRGNRIKKAGGIALGLIYLQDVKRILVTRLANVILRAGMFNEEVPVDYTKVGVIARIKKDIHAVEGVMKDWRD